MEILRLNEGEKTGKYARDASVRQNQFGFTVIQRDILPWRLLSSSYRIHLTAFSKHNPIFNIFDFFFFGFIHSYKFGIFEFDILILFQLLHAETIYFRYLLIFEDVIKHSSWVNLFCIIVIFLNVNNQLCT